MHQARRYNTLHKDRQRKKNVNKRKEKNKQTTKCVNNTHNIPYGCATTYCLSCVCANFGARISSCHSEIICEHIIFEHRSTLLPRAITRLPTHGRMHAAKKFALFTNADTKAHVYASREPIRRVDRHVCTCTLLWSYTNPNFLRT